jgi:predicted N-acetyltransferase YhbS
MSSESPQLGLPGRWSVYQKSERRKEELPMAIAVRPIEPADVPEAGRICHDAFKAIAGQHNFPPDFPEPDAAINLLSRLTANLGFYGVVAEQDGRIVGSNFVDERSPIIGLGPITVDPAAQNQGVGAALMRHMVDRAEFAVLARK